MNSTNINIILEKHKSKIDYVGGKSPIVNQLKHIINNNSSDSERIFAIEGIWAHQKLIMTNIEIKAFFFCPECIYSDEAMQVVEKSIIKSERSYVISKKILQKLSERDDPDGMISIGLLPIYEIEKLCLKDNAVIVILDGLETPGNVGTILRTCDGAGVDAVFICNKKARVTNPKLIKGSMGAAFVVPIIEFKEIDDCIKWLRSRSFNVYLADTRAVKNYRSFDYNGNIALVVGSERYGISEKWYNCNTHILSIPMNGICDSLNVGIAASIITYEICLKKGSDCKLITAK